MIQILINFQNEMKNLAKFTHFDIFIFIQQWLTQNIWSIGAIICIFSNKLQNISFKNSFIWKSEKWLKKTHNPFVK
jgi:pantothenate kinase